MSSGASSSIKRDQDHEHVIWLALHPLLIAAAGLAAYFNSFQGVFLFDDRLHILGRRRIDTLWPLWETLSRRRPVVDYSLALNYAVCGESVWGYHAVNVTVHILAALTLFGVVRRTLRSESFRERFGRSSAWFALVVALIWVVHPLLTQSVTYIIQRAESLMGLFYLLTLYFVIRGTDSARRVCWYAAAAVSCALGMGCKAVMVTAPAMVLLYDWMFVSGSLVRTLRRRWGLYVALVATWGVLWMCGIPKAVLDPSTKGTNVGFGFKGVTPLEYGLTQFGVLVEYLRLSLWPHPLCLDYDWPVARTVGEILPPALLIGGLLAVTAWAFVKRSPLAFVGAWFFIILSATSSFVPVKDLIFEHRMYLSPAAVVVAVVFGVDFALGRLAARFSLGNGVRQWVSGALVVTAVVSLGYGTVRRNAVYHSEAQMWHDVRAKYPASARATENLGTALLAEGRIAEALPALRDAIRVNPNSPDVHNGLGFALVAHGRIDEAVESFRQALRLKPNFARAHFNLGNALSNKGRVDEAMKHFQAAVRLRPGYADARLNLGNVLLGRGRIAEAVDQYREILRRNPDHPSAGGNLGTALLNMGRIDEAVATFRRALRASPQSHSVHNGLGIALASRRELDEAIEAFRQAIALKPNFAGAHYNLANCLFEKGELDAAIRHFRTTLQINPANPNTHYDLGMALAKQGRIHEAIQEYRQTLRIKPDHAGARKALQAASTLISDDGGSDDKLESPPTDPGEVER